MTYPDMQSKSAHLYERAKNVLPWGSTRQAAFFKPYPIYAAFGNGSRVTDVDGVERIDYVCNYSALMHGHCHPRIVEALREQAGKLLSIALPTEAEVRLAEMICERMPGIDRIRFCNSGTEGVMFTIKAARAYTNRPMIAKVEGAYHGSDDTASISTYPMPDSWGDPDAPDSVAPPGTTQHCAEDVRVIPMNDAEAARRIINEHRDQLAAVLVDPMVKNLGYEQATPEFIGAIREETSKHGILLIFDEVYSFRLGYNGAQGVLGVNPDLTAMGKIIGGGLPVGAVGGSAAIMDELFDQSTKPRLEHSGTFNANPMTMAAGAAAMELLTPDEFDRVAALGDRARSGLAEAIDISGAKAIVRGTTSVIALFHTTAEQEMHTYRDIMTVLAQDPAMMERSYRFFVHMLNNGVLMTPYGFMLLSTAMNESDIDIMLEAALSGLRALQGTAAA
jgi:glutamate-1-semialdehyde 2,1-aminomutase